MRFLFVYQDYSDKAHRIVEALAVSDVTVIVVRKKEDYPSREELDLIGNGQPDAAICQVVRKYKKNIDALVNIQYEAKSFREDDLQLKQWLQPAPAAAAQPLRPSESFANVLAECESLIIARQALAAVDDIHQRRWAFVQNACVLLRRHAQGEDLGPMRDWEARFGVAFAANGQVSFCCEVPERKQKWPASEWHLKEGDKTSADDAPRIYFDVLEIDNQRRVIISYAGPHPKDGKYSAAIDL